MFFVKLLIIVLTFVGFSYSVFGWSYPLREITKPVGSCKYRLWSNTPQSCRISLPKLTPSDYTKYLNDVKFYRRIYTVLWLASYKGGWDIKNGTHLGVDIATNVGTPVYSIGPGKVIIAGWKKGRGKVVVIKHKVNGTYIYSVYAHLSKIDVKVGQIVNENTKIGEVGNTGHSWGAHLHFQIDRANAWYHPFWFKGCKGSIKDIVNSSSCIAQATKYTLDPLEFLATNGAVVKKTETEIIKKIPKIDRKNIITLEEIKKQEIKEFVNSVKLKVKLYNAGVYYKGQKSYFKVYLKDRRGRNYKRIFPDSLNVIYDKNYISYVIPDGFREINGFRKVEFLPKKEGVTFITIKMGDFVLANKSLRIVKKGEKLEVKDGSIITLPRIKYLSSSIWGINIFKDKNYLNIIKVPFKGNFVLTSANKNLYFCKAPTDIRKLNTFKCTWYNAYKSLDFSYSDTIAGLFLFKFFSINSKNDNLIVKNTKGVNIVKQPVYFRDIKLTDPRTIYKQDIKSACAKGLCLNLLNRGYLWINKELSLDKMKYLLQNFSFNLGKKIPVFVNYADNYKKITRKEFVLALFNLLGMKPNKIGEMSYIDVKDEKFKAIVYYLDRLGFSWKDRFAKYHFQPAKNITYEEALYLTNFLLDKILHR